MVLHHARVLIARSPSARMIEPTVETDTSIPSALPWIHRFGGGASAKKASWAGRLLMFNVNDHSTTGGTFCVCIFAQIGPAFSDL